MSNVTLSRVVKPVVVNHHGRVTLEQRVETISVRFTDRNGKSVSLVFDGRFDSEAAGSGMVRETYVKYADCPVMMDSGPVIDRNTVRALRDALNALDLGD